MRRWCWIWLLLILCVLGGTRDTFAAETASATETASAGEGHDVNIAPVMIVYCVLIVLASLGGGFLPLLIKLTHARMQMMVSLVAGLMLGIGLFHMLPHAVAELQSRPAATASQIEGSLDLAIYWLMGGLLGMFFLIRAFHFHSHGDVPEQDGEQHDHDCDHQHHHHTHQEHSHPLTWTGVAFGLALHTLIDGMALAASVQADAAHLAGWSFWGFGTFLAIMLHKPLDAVSITSLMTAGGWSTAAKNAVNFGFALMCPLGAVLFFAGVSHFADSQHLIVGCALAAAAGVFLCISLGDLLPEVEFHCHDRMKLSILLILGIALAWGIGFLEPAHSHGSAHSHEPTQNNAPAESEEHNHSHGHSH